MSSRTLEQNEQADLLEQEMEEAALYALGALDQHEARLFEDALAADPSLAAELQAFDQVVASLALSASEAAPPPALRQKLLEQVVVLEQAPPQPRAAQLDNPPTISLRLDEGKWHRLAPHVYSKVLYADSQTGLVTSLIKLEPGGCLPRHRHLGIEQTLVVEGACRVNGEVFYPGDFRLRPAGTEDTEVTTEHGTIILLIAPARCELLAPGWPS